METELFDVRHAFKQISLKDMNKSSNKRYVKQHGNVKKTCNYLRNVFLSDDGEQIRCVRPGNNTPQYIRHDGKPITSGKKRYGGTTHTAVNHHKIRTQQQWNKIIKIRQERQQRIATRNNNSQYKRSYNDSCMRTRTAAAKPSLDLHNRMTVKPKKARKGRVNMKLMKRNRNKQRQNKVHRLQDNQEYSFMALNNAMDEGNTSTDASLFSN